MSSAVTVDGADRLARTLAGAAGEVTDLAAINRRAASLVAGRVHPPRLSGALAASITGRADRAGMTVGSALVYAPVQEYGWPAHSIRPRRYLSAAWEQSIGDVVELYADHVADAIAGVRGA